MIVGTGPCPTCGPTLLEQHPRLAGVVRCTNCKNHIREGVVMETDEKSEPEHERVKAALSDWWTEQSRQEIEGVVPKAVEYGSTDLAVIGRAQGRLMGRDNLSHEEATELGIFFYLIGKLARWEDAIVHGRRVSDDTLHDAAVYIKMQQRNRAVGGWPFAPETEEKA